MSIQYVFTKDEFKLILKMYKLLRKDNQQSIIMSRPSLISGDDLIQLEKILEIGE